MSTFDANTIHALIALLADDDPEIVNTISTHLVQIGEGAVPHLTAAKAAQPHLAPRLDRVLDEIHVFQLENALTALTTRPQDHRNLELGAFLIARYAYPEIHVEEYSARLDALADGIRARLEPTLTHEEALTVFNHYVFVEQGFHGNIEHYDDPDNSFMNRVIDRRTGIPISLSVLYLLIGWRLNLPIFGVGTPGHFLVKFELKRFRVFVDCFNGGTLLTERDCARFLIKSGYGFQTSYLHRCPTHATLARMLRNLLALYRSNGQPEKAAHVSRLINAFQMSQMA